jgi:type 1 glutamine amidotransferase
VQVHITRPEHPLVSGLADFTLGDEVYGDLALEPDVVPLMEATAIDANRGTHRCCGSAAWVVAAWCTTRWGTMRRR